MRINSTSNKQDILLLKSFRKVFKKIKKENMTQEISKLYESAKKMFNTLKENRDSDLGNHLRGLFGVAVDHIKRNFV